MDYFLTLCYIIFGDIMNQIILYVTNGLVILSFICYFILVLIGRTKKVTNSDGFNITKDIIHEYNSINIILSKSYFTIYNIKRRVIRMAKRCYYGNTVSDIAISLIEAGISSVDDKKNKIINFLRSIFPNIKCLYLFPLIGVIINSQTYNISDAKVSIVFFILFAIISYMVIDIKSSGVFNICNNIDKIKDINIENKERIISFMNNVNVLDKLVFISELMMIIRAVLIILDM